MIATQNAPVDVARKLKFPPEVAAAERLEKTGPVMIDVKSIDRGDNPREAFDQAELQALADSMTSLSLLAPLTITSAGPGAYRLIAGERRLRAAKLAGWRKVPCYVVNGPPELLAEMCVVENLLRVDLNLIEKARAIELLNRPIAAGGAGMPLVKIASRLGHKEAWAVKMAALLKLPAKWQKKLAAGELMFRQGYALAGYADRPDVLTAAEADMTANPADWNSAAGFDCSLTHVVARLDAMVAGTPAEAAENGAARAVIPRGGTAAVAASLPLPIARRSAPVRHDLAETSAGKNGDDGHLVSPPPASQLIGSSERATAADPVAAILELIGQLATLGAIERVERALRAREAAIARQR
jgi:ParB/RepB/Spo0J family partition protein